MIGADRLVELYERADEPTREAGRAWYPAAWTEARELSRLAPSGVGPVATAAVIAALSPRLRWAHNLRSARAAVRAASAAPVELFGRDAVSAAVAAAATDALPFCRGLAGRILSGERPERVIRGPKSRAFWRAIRGDADSVTIDVWAALALGIDPDRLTPRVIRGAQSDYGIAAGEVGESPRDFQAICWLAFRGAKPSDPTPFRPIEGVA